jgi:integrase/recombinase XerD
MMHARNNTAAPLRDARAGASPRLATATPIRAAGNAGTLARAGTRALYASHLATATSKAGDLYSRRTVESYLEAVDALAAHLAATGYEGDYADLGPEELNGFLAAYRRGHSQGGTNTKLRRLWTFLGWVEATYEAPSPFRTGRVAYYAPAEPPPAALGADVAADMLARCAGKAYEDVRDAAIIRLLLTGVRRAELVNLYVEDVDLAGRAIRVGAFKSARARAGVVRIVNGEEHRAGRLVPLNDATILAIQRWLRMRAGHKLVDRADAGPMWYGTRGRSRLTGNGVLRMVKRRAQEAGYDPATIGVHAFRHTRADELLRADVAEGDVMGVMGWRDRSMIDRYARNLKNERAVEAVRRAGLA